MSNKIGNTIKCRSKANDVIFTPKPVALKMIEVCNITPEMSVLDCSKGAGIFYDNLHPCNKSWCEIQEGKDFFDTKEKVDLIIGNPPYSVWDKWLEHTAKLTNKFCFLFGFLNLTRRRVKRMFDLGFGITYMHLLEVDWWFGRSFIVIFERNKPSIMSVDNAPVLCDICNTKCGRGRNGRDLNVCTLIK